MMKQKVSRTKGKLNSRRGFSNIYRIVAGMLPMVGVPFCAYAQESTSDMGTDYVRDNVLNDQDAFQNIEKNNNIYSTKEQDIPMAFVLNSTDLKFNYSKYNKKIATAGTWAFIYQLLNPNNANNKNLPELKDKDGSVGKPNAIVVRYYDKTELKYKYKVHATVVGTSVKQAAYGKAFQYYSSIFYDKEVQSEIYNAIKDGEKDSLREIINNYLPEVYYARLPESIINLVSSSLSNQDPSSVLFDIDEDYLAENAKSIVDVRYSLKIDTRTTGGTSEKIYSYNTYQVVGGDAWTPMDRAIKITELYGEGDYYAPKYWVTGEQSGEADELSADNTLKPKKSGEQVGEHVSGGQEKAVSDGAITAITVKDLTMQNNSSIDLAYVNTNGANPLVVKGKTVDTGLVDDGNKITVAMQRYLLVDNAQLGDNVSLRLGAYGMQGDSTGKERKIDSVLIKNAQALNQGAKININIGLGFVPEVLDGTLSGAWSGSSASKDIYGTVTIQNQLLGIYSGAESVDVTAEKTVADGIFSSYEITPEIERYDDYYKTATSEKIYTPQADGNYYTNVSGNTSVIMNKEGMAPFRPTGENGELTKDDKAYLESQGAAVSGYSDLQGSVWYLKGYTYANTGDVAESGKSAAENSTALKNFVKANNASLFRRFDSLHVENLNQPQAAGEDNMTGTLRENLWGDIWHGRFSSQAAYNRKTSQSYNGVQLGYDKLLSKKLYGGKVYSGVYASKLDGKSTTLAGKGEQDGYGVGVYSTWLGDAGHFIDVGVHAAKIKNEYHFTGNTGDGMQGRVNGDNSTWSYGVGAQYGLHNKLGSEWFVEPSVSFYLGHTDESSYVQSNGLGIHEGGYDSAIGRLNLKAGRDLGEKANIYAGVSYAHDFAGEQELEQSYGTQTRRLQSVGGSDSWWEWSVGGKAKISSNGTLNLDFVKTTGSSVGNEWSINGGLNFSWGGFGSGSTALPAEAVDTAKAISPDSSYPKAQAPTVVLGRAPKAEVQQTDLQEGNSKQAAAQYDNSDNSSVTVQSDGSVLQAGVAEDGMNEFDLGALTVEAKRPDWEKSLSPGQVSVIYTDQFAGEQKNLPQLLDRVPGLFVQKINGEGHYTVARMRGSTAAQVSVYVDGVQMNLSGDVAVNLSAIPADNVERIEVYRGYVPARFAGAPLGGVINIVTKKPKEGHGYITQGVRSYGGYTGTYEYSMPLGSGSLMATYARDVWHGDFDYTYPEYSDGKDESFTRRSNGYQNSNGMLKWQDEHWIVKGVWKKNHEELAKAIGSRYTMPYFVTGYYDANMDIDYKEFMLGRRDTLGNLDLGWHLAYTDNNKKYRNVGGYKYINDTLIAKNGGKPLPFPGVIQGVTEEDYLPGALWGDYHSKKWNANANLSYKAGSKHLLELNVDATRETMNTNGNRWDLTQQALDNITGANYTVHKMLSKYNNREYHLTFQDTITLNDDGDFKLTPVLRADKVEMEGLGDLGDSDSKWQYSGGLALQKQINDHWSFKSTWGTYNRHPNFYETFGDGGLLGQNYIFHFLRTGQINMGENQSSIKTNGLWETGRQFDFSLNWQGKLAGADTDTILTYYRRDAENQMVMYTPRNGGITSYYFPVSAIKAYGLELSHNMKWERWGLNLAATWQKSRETGDKLHANWVPSGSAYVPEWVLSARVDYTFPGDKLSMFGEYRYTGEEVLRGESSSDEAASGAEVQHSYSIFDIGAKYKFDKNWRLSAGVNDVFDKGRDVFVTTYGVNGPVKSLYYPLTGRMYYATLEYSF